jgi:hypothetical protein
MRFSVCGVTPHTLALFAAMLLCGACDGAPRKESRIAEGVEPRAAQLLAALRNADWTSAARFVYLDTNTRDRMGIGRDVSTEEAKPKVEAWFTKLYGTVRPGLLRSVTVDPAEPTRATVSYRHGDLDAFTMRFVNGDWFYVVE